MTLDGYHVDVMSSKTWACWIFFVVFVLSLGVAENCLNFEDQVKKNLFKDHLFVIQDFTPPSEALKVEYTVLSIVNMLCSNLGKHEGLHVYDPNTKIKDQDSLIRVKWTFEKIVRKFLGLDLSSNIKTNCEKHSCNFSHYKTITLSDLESMYKSACSWEGTLPACPSPKNTSPSPSQVSSTAPTSAPAYPSTSTPSPTTSHQSEKSTSSSLIRPRNMTAPSASNNPSTSTPSPTTSHQSEKSTSSSLIRPRNMTAPSASNNDTLTGAQTADILITQNQTFLLLLTVSVMVNVVLIIAVCRQRNRLQRYPMGCPENCLQYQNTELIHLQTRDQSQSKDNGSLKSQAQRTMPLDHL
ncbi:uncharacterized protein [Salminus brasiliensis]|uniref:uncharacterized protein isoform X2 n=1 Tax=Salminus brasiliensis TaxID=930266 RepID=UPI003B832731